MVQWLSGEQRAHTHQTPFHNETCPGRIDLKLSYRPNFLQWYGEAHYRWNSAVNAVGALRTTQAVKLANRLISVAVSSVSSVP